MLTALAALFGSLGPGSDSCIMCLRVHNTAVKTTVVHVEIVDMRPWSWVLRLLLLLRGSVVTACLAFGVLLSLHSVVYDDSNTGTLVLGTWT